MDGDNEEKGTKKASLAFSDHSTYATACANFDKANFKLPSGASFKRDVRGIFSNFMPQTSVYVRNLPEGTTEDDLYKVFSEHGVVLAAQVSFPAY